MIQIIKGNLLLANEDIICHQVNCQGVMGSGVALGVKQAYPDLYNLYRKECRIYGKQLLGTIQEYQSGNKTIVNMFAQDNYGLGFKHTRYLAFVNCCKVINRIASASQSTQERTIAMPYLIGCGRGGGNWNVIYSLLEEVFEDKQLTLYRLEC